MEGRPTAAINRARRSAFPTGGPLAYLETWGRAEIIEGRIIPGNQEVISSAIGATTRDEAGSIVFIPPIAIVDGDDIADTTPILIRIAIDRVIRVAIRDTASRLGSGGEPIRLIITNRIITAIRITSRVTRYMYPLRSIPAIRSVIR